MGIGYRTHLKNIWEVRQGNLNLVEAVETILTDNSYRESALKYKHIVDGYNGPKKGAQLIDSYLANR